MAMHLQAYLDSKNLRASTFAAVLGVPASTITRIIKGERVPGLHLVQKIQKATKGAVTADDLPSVKRVAA